MPEIDSLGNCAAKAKAVESNPFWDCLEEQSRLMIQRSQFIAERLSHSRRDLIFACGHHRCPPLGFSAPYLIPVSSLVPLVLERLLASLYAPAIVNRFGGHEPELPLQHLKYIQSIWHTSLNFLDISSLFWPTVPELMFTSLQCIAVFSPSSDVLPEPGFF